MKKDDHGKYTPWHVEVISSKGSVTVTGMTTEGKDKNDNPIPYVTVGGSKDIPERYGDYGIDESIACKSTSPDKRDISVNVTANHGIISCVEDQYYNLRGSISGSVTNKI